jgi:hypothetical protein
MFTSCLSTGACRAGELRDALRHAGGNRSELEIAMSKVKGADTEYLIANASQYDLVNLTTEQIIENVTYARKVCDEALPYLGERLDDELWRQWVLPHRVLEEDLCLWRRDFYELMQPVVAGKTTTAEAAEAIRFWLWGEGGLSRKVVAEESENRLRSPVDILKGGTASCGELSVLHVSFLRAVGIPARHCSTGRWVNKDGWHFYVEYWDNQIKRWVATDDISVPPAARVKRGDWCPVMAYAAFGFSDFENAYYTEDFSKLMDVTGNLGELREYRMKTPSGSPGTAEVAVWNTNVWRKVGNAEHVGENLSFRVAKGQARNELRPFLVTMVRDGELHWSITDAGNSDSPQTLELAVAGKCLRLPVIAQSENAPVKKQ